MYTQITINEFKDFLKPELGWKYTIPEGSKEQAASLRIHEGLWVRVWTSITVTRARDCGKDAIRVVIYQNYDGTFLPVKKYPIVTRQQNWKKHLESRLEEAMTWEPEEDCPVCGAAMMIRKPKKKAKWQPFWGCVRYPNCKGSKNIPRQN